MNVQMAAPPLILNITNTTSPHAENPQERSNAYDQVVPLIFGVAISAVIPNVFQKLDLG
jgi:hypothetical protein